MTAIFMLARPLKERLFEKCNMGYDHPVHKEETMWVIVVGAFSSLDEPTKQLSKYEEEGWKISFGTIHGVVAT